MEARGTKSITTARKGVLKLVKLKNLAAKYCKMRKKYSPAKSANCGLTPILAPNPTLTPNSNLTLI
jgi:hypothetical protein